jgi:hypothetical protein
MRTPRKPASLRGVEWDFARRATRLAPMTPQKHSTTTTPKPGEADVGKYVDENIIAGTFGFDPDLLREMAEGDPILIRSRVGADGRRTDSWSDAFIAVAALAEVRDAGLGGPP